MKILANFLKSTIVGGLLFLIPLVLIILVLRQARDLALKVATPIAANMPAGLFGGVKVATVLAVLILVLVAFIAGLVARTSVGARITAWFENSVMGAMPQYRMVKSMAEGFAHLETSTDMQPVLVRGEEGWQLGYRLEELPGGWVAVFLPQAPTPMSGNLVYVMLDKIKPLDISMPEAVMLVKRIGIGSAATLRGVDLGKSSAKDAVG